MNCTNCGHELSEGSKFCTECGQPVRMAYEPGKTRTKKKKKQISPFKKILKVLLIIALIIVGLVVAFVLSAVVVGLFGGGDTETAAPIATQVPITTPAPIETPEPTPEPAPEMLTAVLNYVGSYTAEQFNAMGIACKYSLPYDDCLCIHMYEDLSFEACKAIGAVGFIDLEDDLHTMYNTVISYVNEFESMQGQEYDIFIMYMSNDEKNIMTYSENGVDYKIK